MPAKPQLSVVVPTFNRADAVDLTLQRLKHQTLPADEFEVVIVDDGSWDTTAQIVAAQSLSLPFHCNYLQQQNKGAAATRNVGVSHAQADIILFLDIDVVPDTALLATHLKNHDHPDKHMIVGRVKPWPDAYKAWYETISDPDVGMDYGEREKMLPFYMALGGNLSVKKAVFEDLGGFDETYPAAGCEETEFAYRAQQKGIPLFYQPEAIGYHNHPRTLARRCQQQAAHMRSMALLIYQHPELQTEIPGVDDLMPLWKGVRSLRVLWRRIKAAFFGSILLRHITYRALSLTNARRWSPRLTSFLFWRLMLGYCYAGFQEGLALYKDRIHTV